MAKKSSNPNRYPCGWYKTDYNPLDRKACFWCGQSTSTQEDFLRFTRIANAYELEEKAKEAGFYPRIDPNVLTQLLVRSCPSHQSNSDILSKIAKDDKKIGLSSLVEAARGK
jgi:hypothetical protein